MKEFNITGTCYPHLHYMVDTSDKQKKIFDMISKGEYFNINRPRQYGKSTTMYLLQQLLLKTDGRLNIEMVLHKFQEVIKEKYTETKLLENDHFLEEDLRILFLVFLKPILNGIGFCFKEVKTGEEKRIDVIIVFKDEKLLVELKMWRGVEYHKKGLTQLKKSMKLESVNKGYMLIMSKNKSIKYTDDYEDGIMMLWL